MTSLAFNPFALLSEDAAVVEAAKPKPKTVVAAAPAPEVKKAAPKDDKPRRDARSGGAQRGGRGGRASAPRAPRENNGEETPRERPARTQEDGDRPRSERAPRGDRPRGDRAPRGDRPPRGREYDRRSGSDRVDGEKKEVAGHSWGEAVDPALEGASAEAALAVTEQAGAETAEKPAAPKAEPEEEPVKTFDDYLKEQAAKKKLAAKPKRKANEGVDDSNWKGAKPIEKVDIDQEDDIVKLLAGKPKAAPKKKTSEKKEAFKVANDLLKFTFADAQQSAPRGDRPPRRDGDRPPRREGGDRPQGDRPPRREGGDRPQGDRPPRREGGDRPARREGGDRPQRSAPAARTGKAPAAAGSVNINDSKAFPSLA